MSESKKSNDEEKERSDGEDINAIEARRTSSILRNQARRAQCGSVAQICKTEPLEPELYKIMRDDWIYSIISNEEDECPITGSLSYQVSWAYAHLPYGNSFFNFVAPVQEHDFTVIKFTKDEDENDDVEITRQFKKHNGEWQIIEYNGGYSCEFCEAHSCDRAQYRDELETMYEQMAQMGVPHNQKRYMMYRQSIAVKYGLLGNQIWHKLDEFVQELIVGHFPVETGKSKCGFQAVKHNE